MGTRKNKKSLQKNFENRDALFVLIPCTLLSVLIVLGVTVFCGEDFKGHSHRSYIEIVEGPWPIMGYSTAMSDDMNPLLEYPSDWAVFSDLDAESEFSKNSKAEKNLEQWPEGGGRIQIYIEYFDNKNTYLAKVNDNEYLNHIPITSKEIGGVEIRASTIGTDNTTGSVQFVVFAADEHRVISITYFSKSGRSNEEYFEVLNRLVDSLQIDFDIVKKIRPPLM